MLRVDRRHPPKSVDDAYSNRFTPRRPGSNWSAINIAKVAELKKQKRMTPAGLAAFAKRTEAKSRIYTYEQQASPTFDKALEKKFKANKKAWDVLPGPGAVLPQADDRWVNMAKQAETRCAGWTS